MEGEKAQAWFKDALRMLCLGVKKTKELLFATPSAMRESSQLTKIGAMNLVIQR